MINSLDLHDKLYQGPSAYEYNFKINFGVTRDPMEHIGENKIWSPFYSQFFPIIPSINFYLWLQQNKMF